MRVATYDFPDVVICSLYGQDQTSLEVHHCFLPSGCAITSTQTNVDEGVKGGDTKPGRSVTATPRGRSVLKNIISVLRFLSQSSPNR